MKTHYFSAHKSSHENTLTHRDVKYAPSIMLKRLRRGKLISHVITGMEQPHICPDKPIYFGRHFHGDTGTSSKDEKDTMHGTARASRHPEDVLTRWRHRLLAWFRYCSRHLALV